MLRRLPRFIWQRPIKAEVLQFTGTEVTALGLLSDQFRIACMPAINEEINVHVLIRTLLRLRFTRWQYYAEFVRCSDSRAVLVWHDTNVHALQLQSRVNVPVLCIQNGIRHDLGPAAGEGYFSSIRRISKHRRPQVSDYWVFGEASRQILETHIDARYHTHGSFRANHYASNQSRERVPRPKRRVALIASFPNATEVPTGQIRNNQHPFLRRGEREISYHDWFKIDALAATSMVKAASEFGLECSVIAKRPGDDTSEHRFFHQLIGKKEVMVVGHEKGDGYQLADSFDFLIATDSTLGYEMLALGRRVAFLSGRFNILGIDSQEMSFGYPLPLPSDGPFWSSADSEGAIVEFLRGFFSLNDADWLKHTSEIVPLVMSVDKNNSALRRQLAEYVGQDL